jgi:hypothetical protein
MNPKNTELNFPIFNTPENAHVPMSMDEYDAFVTEDLRECFDREAYEKEKLRRVVNVMFTLTD